MQSADIAESPAPDYVGQDSDLDPMFFEEKPEEAAQEPLDAELADLLEVT